MKVRRGLEGGGTPMNVQNIKCRQCVCVFVLWSRCSSRQQQEPENNQKKQNNPKLSTILKWDQLDSRWVCPSGCGLDLVFRLSKVPGGAERAGPLHPSAGGSLDPDEQPVEECAALLLRDPLYLWVTEARIQRLAVAERMRSHLVGARTHAHLESHLGLVTAVRTGVPKSAGGEPISVSNSNAPFLFVLTAQQTYCTLGAKVSKPE